MDNVERSAAGPDGAPDDLAARIWEQATQRLRAELAEATWHAWFQGARAVRFEHDILVLAVPNQLAADKIRTSYHAMVDATLLAATGRACSIELLVATDAADDGSVVVGLAEPPPVTIDVPVVPPASESIWASGTLNPRYTFDQFVIGASNRFAHAAALSVAEAPAQAYNPLFVYGPAGLGKTHLMQAIGHMVRSLYPKKRVRYVSTESFMNDFVEAIRDRTRMPVFKRRYRDLDVLLIDDIQFLERTQELQEEFFHTFNQIHNEGGQIVISSDRSPKSIATLEDRLRSRFEWGLITDVQPPEFETRLAILRKKAEAEHLGGIPDEVLGFIASNIQDNIRELEGALIRVAAYSSLHRAPLSEEVAPERPLRPPPDHQAPGDHRGAHPRRDGEDVRVDGRGPVREEPASPPRHGPPDRHVRDAQPDRLQLPPHRRGLRRTRPHDGHVRRRQDQVTDDRASHHVRAGQRADRPDPAREQWVTASPGAALWTTLWTGGETPSRSGDSPRQPDHHPRQSGDGGGSSVEKATPPDLRNRPVLHIPHPLLLLLPLVPRTVGPMGKTHPVTRRTHR